MPKYLAINAFGINGKDQLPEKPQDGYNSMDHMQLYQTTLVKEITKKIVKEYRARSISFMLIFKMKNKFKKTNKTHKVFSQKHKPASLAP
jgi:hypothetical protein